MLWRVLGQEKFKQYRARLRASEPSPLLAGRKLSLYDWTYFEAKELEPKNFFMRLVIRSRIDDKTIEVEGTRDGETWVPVTRWLFNIWRNAEIRARAEDAARGKTGRRRGKRAGKRDVSPDNDLVAEIRGARRLCRPKPKMSEGAYHVAVCRMRGEGMVFEILTTAGYKDVVEANVPDLIKYGARRIRDGIECSICKYARKQT